MSNVRQPHGEIRVWCSAFDLLRRFGDALSASLSPDERRKADRFVFQDARERFVLARGAVRHILASYLQVETEEVTFLYGGNGKPHLGQGAADLRFNVSHSGRLVAIVVAMGRDVGIDVEEVRPLAQADAIAGRFFTPVESEWLRSLPPAATCSRPSPRDPATSVGASPVLLSQRGQATGVLPALHMRQ